MDQTRRTAAHQERLRTLGLIIGIVVHYTVVLCDDHTVWQTHVWALITLLALAHQLDLRLRSLLTQAEGSYILDRSGLVKLREELGFDSELISERDLKQHLVMYEQDREDDEEDDEEDDDQGDAPAHPSPPSELIEQLTETLLSPEDYSERLICPLTSIEVSAIHRFEHHTVAKLLPGLPEIEGRTQVGIFATRPLSPGAVFLWRSDLGVRWRSASSHLQESTLSTAPSLSEEMNRRPLCQVPGPKTHHDLRLSAAQGASERQRSGPGTLINFSWCHTDSVDAQSSPYRILPPHDLGPANCHFASVIDPRASRARGEFRLCSAIVVDRPIEVGAQLLAFTGQGSSLRAVYFRRALSALLTLITPALVLAPWLRLAMSLSRRAL